MYEKKNDLVKDYLLHENKQQNYNNNMYVPRKIQKQHKLMSQNITTTTISLPLFWPC